MIRAQQFLLITSLLTLGLSALLAQLRARQSQIEVTNAELQRAEAEVLALNADLERRVLERTRDLRHALSHVKRLQGLLAICAWCKKVRDDSDYWHALETYIAENTDATVSHGICPECLARQRGLITRP